MKYYQDNLVSVEIGGKKETCSTGQCGGVEV